MRKACPFLALLALSACGGRSIGDWSAPGSGAGSGSDAASGGFIAGSGTGGNHVSAGGESSNGGSPSSGGTAASGGVASGGSSSAGNGAGGLAAGASAAGGSGSGGGGSCFEATQQGVGLCIHVRLCTMAQYETLCLMDTPSTAVCFCYVDGVATSATSVQGASADKLCAPASMTHCP